MSFNLITQYKMAQNGVVHAIFNPKGSGAVRIHLIPPKFRLFSKRIYAVIINGYYILPLGYSWAVLLANFLNEINPLAGEPLTEEKVNGLAAIAAQKTHKTFSQASVSLLDKDLRSMLEVFFDVAREHTPKMKIGEMSLRDYAKNMQAPHRMDLLVSSLTDDNGKWHCNQKCAFCYAQGEFNSKVKELSTNEWKKIIDNCKTAGICQLTFTGGEPTLRKDLCELIDHSKWFVTRLNTNGLLLTPKLCKDLYSVSLDSVQVTLYSHDPKVHAKLVGGNTENYMKTIDGIKNALAAKLNVSINTPLCKDNKDYIKTLKYLKELGIRYVTCSGLILKGSAKAEFKASDLSENELYDVLKAGAKFCHDNDIEINFTSPGLVAKEKLYELNLAVPMCGACLSNMAIAPNGDAIPCQSWLDEEFGLGNMLTDAWKKIWNNPIAKNIRKMDEADSLSCPFRKRQS